MSRHIEHGFIPQSISHISKKSNNPQDFVEQIRQLNNHIQEKNIIMDAFKKKQSNIMHSESKNFQLINNESIKEDSNQHSQQKNEQQFDIQYLTKQQILLQEHRKQQQKLLQRISNIIEDPNSNQLQRQQQQQQKQLQYLNQKNEYIENENKFDQRVNTLQIKGKKQQLDHRFDYKCEDNSTNAQSQNIFDRQTKIMKHKQESNIKFIMTQIKQILNYNKHFLVQIQKMEVRRKITQTEIQIRKLKIGMRNHVFKKTINYTSPIKKHNDALIVKSPKKTNANILQKFQYLNQKISHFKLKSEQFQKKEDMLNQYERHLMSKNINQQNNKYKEKCFQKLNKSKSISKLNSSIRDQKYSSTRNLLVSLKNKQQKSKVQGTFKNNSDSSNLLGKKAVLILKRQNLKDSIFDFQHFLVNKQARLISQNGILKEQIQILNSQVQNFGVYQNIWVESIRHQNQIQKKKKKTNQRKRFFQFASQPKNKDFANQLRNSKSTTKNQFMFTFKAQNPNDIHKKNSEYSNNKLSLRDVTKIMKKTRQNLNLSRNSLSARLNKSKSQKVVLVQDTLKIENSSKKGTIRTQQSLQRNSMSISAHNQYYGHDIL